MQAFLDWLQPYLTRLEQTPNVGDDVLVTLGTIVAAVLATLTAFVGWYFTGLKERRLDRRQREDAATELKRLRQERIDDIVRAIHAEIVAGIVQSERQLTDDEIQYTINDSSPFATPDESDFVFASIRDELSILPSAVIHPVVCYYRALFQSNLMVRDLRSDDFKSQSPAEKQAYMAGFLSVMEMLRDRGHQALKKLEDYGCEAGFGDVLKAARKQVEERTAASLLRIKSKVNELKAATPMPLNRS